MCHFRSCAGVSSLSAFWFLSVPGLALHKHLRLQRVAACRDMALASCGRRLKPVFGVRAVGACGMLQWRRVALRRWDACRCSACMQRHLISGSCERSCYVSSANEDRTSPSKDHQVRIANCRLLTQVFVCVHCQLHVKSANQIAAVYAISNVTCAVRQSFRSPHDEQTSSSFGRDTCFTCNVC